MKYRFRGGKGAAGRCWMMTPISRGAGVKCLPWQSSTGMIFCSMDRFHSASASYQAVKEQQSLAPYLDCRSAVRRLPVVESHRRDQWRKRGARTVAAAWVSWVCPSDAHPWGCHPTGRDHHRARASDRCIPSIVPATRSRRCTAASWQCFPRQLFLARGELLA